MKPKVLSGNRALEGLLTLVCAIGFSGLNIDGLAIDFIFCVDVWFPLVPLLPMVPKIVLDLQIRIQQWISAEISEGLFANS